jgi:23S rRNA (adenine2503-C2)-methyltransferase
LESAEIYHGKFKELNTTEVKVKVFAVAGKDDVARVYMAEFGPGKAIELVEAVQPPLPREKKWVLMVSTLFGCPVGCQICDAGGSYQGKLSAEEILAQIDFMVSLRFPDGKVPVENFKIQFARMGEPAFNLAVLDVLEALPARYDAPGLMPSLSTIAPNSAEEFFSRLPAIKDRYYADGQFQFQFSIHTTSEAHRDQMIPVKKWNFERMAEYGRSWHRPGDRKITLNFALVDGMPVDPQTLLNTFDPERYLIKITPVNPTSQATKHGHTSHVDPYRPEKVQGLVDRLRASGYEVIVSIGEVEENQIGSNCGQYVMRYMAGEMPVKDGYTYPVQSFSHTTFPLVEPAAAD